MTEKNQTSPKISATEIDSTDFENRFLMTRLVEAILFANAEPVSQAFLEAQLPEELNVELILNDLQEKYAGAGVNLYKSGDSWAFRTAPDLSLHLQNYSIERKKLSRAAQEVLAIIAYHQPVSRSEIEEIRGVQLWRGVMDVLMETRWIKMRGRRQTPGRPITYGTTEKFLAHFALESITDLPGLEEMKGAGLLDPELSSDFSVPRPNDLPGSGNDEDPLDDEEEVIDEFGDLDEEIDHQLDDREPSPVLSGS